MSFRVSSERRADFEAPSIAYKATSQSFCAKNREKTSTTDSTMIGLVWTLNYLKRTIQCNRVNQARLMRSSNASMLKAVISEHEQKNYTQKKTIPNIICHHVDLVFQSK